MTPETPFDDLPTQDAVPGGSSGGASGPVPEHPEEIGPYRILEVLGEGGMGVVYLAEQTRPIARRVALKVMKPGGDTREIVARFEAERQALAVMDHPSIAKVFDAGVASGRPFFAMELVHGVPITKYCDDNRLSTAERVTLFVQVCQAVQHAHQKGVIHRDLKPSNVLVTVTDEKPVPKVIDFGIAKATGTSLGEKPLVTQFGVVLGTPEFMSPEQFEMSGLDVDTRTDVYSLGVMLYLLLSGSMPIDVKEMAKAWPNVPRLLKEKDPRTPSSRPVTAGGDGERVAAWRHTDARSLSRQLSGDLDWITLKAMAFDRQERYETANALANDLQRHLRSEPVTARPPTLAYRADRFVRRNKAGTAFAATVALLLVAFSVASVVQARRIARERDRAEQESAKATAINAFLTEVLGSADPEASGARDVTLVEALKQSAGKIESSFGKEPLLAAAARRTIATTYSNLGLYKEADPLLRSALSAQTALLGKEHREIADTLSVQASLAQRMGTFEEAIRLEKESLAMRRRLLGDGDASVANSLAALAGYLEIASRYDEGQRAGEESLEIRRRLFGEKSKEVAGSLLELGKLAFGKSDFKTSEALERRALAIQRALPGGASHPALFAVFNELALNKVEQGDYPAAEAFYKDAIAEAKSAYGEEHSEVAIAMENLGGVYFRAGRQKETLALLQQVLAMRKKVLGENHVAVARTLINTGTVAQVVGDLETSERLYAEAIPRLRRAMGPDHADVGSALLSWGKLRLKRGDAASAEPLCREALQIYLGKVPKTDPRIGDVDIQIGRALAAQGKNGEAERLLLEGRALRLAANGAKDRVVGVANDELVKLYERWGKPEKAAEVRASIAPAPAPTAAGH